MDGIVYMLDQAGRALSQANERIELLSKEIERLRLEQGREQSEVDLSD